MHCLVRLLAVGIVVGGSLAATPGVGGADSFTPLPANSPVSITSCTFSPGEVRWTGPADVVPIRIHATPDGGLSVYSVSVKPDGGRELPWLDNFTFPRATPPNGTDFVEYIGATYDSLLEALGGSSGTVYLAVYLPTAASLADSPLCEAAIQIVGPGDLPVVGSAILAATLRALILVCAGAACLIVSHRRRSRGWETLAL